MLQELYNQQYKLALKKYDCANNILLYLNTKYEIMVSSTEQAMGITNESRKNFQNLPPECVLMN